MPGTKSGGRAAAKTNKLVYGKDFYKRIGALGGAKRTPETKLKGFGTNRHLASVAGAKGGRIGKRGPAQPKDLNNFKMSYEPVRGDRNEKN